MIPPVYLKNCTILLSYKITFHFSVAVFKNLCKQQKKLPDTKFLKT